MQDPALPATGSAEQPAPASSGVTAVAVIPPPVRLLFGVLSWWLTRGTAGTATSKETEPTVLHSRNRL